MGKPKKEAPKVQSLPEFLKSLVGEDQMHDDHGLVIIGSRDKKPQIPPEPEEKEK